MLPALFALLLAAAPAALHDHLLAGALYDLDADGKPDEIRILAPEAELHTGEPMCAGCPPEDFVAGRFVADVKLTTSGRTVRTPLVFAPEEPAWSLKKYGRPGPREDLRFPYRQKAEPLEIKSFGGSPYFDLVQFLGPGDPEDDSQYSLFTLKPDGRVVPYERSTPNSIVIAGDRLSDNRLQWIWTEIVAPPAPPEPPRPVCRWDEAAPKSPAARGYSFCVFGRNWFELGLGYESQPALRKVRRLPEKEAVACFGSESIESYDWESQKLTLTREATGRLVHAIQRYESEVERTGADAEFAAGAEKLNNLLDSLDWSSDIELDLRLRAFQVRLDGKPLYGGIFLDPTSQMAIDFPVARAHAESDCRAAVSFLPVQMPFVDKDPVDEAGKLRDFKEDTGLVDEEADFFAQLIRDLALTPNAFDMRKLVRDPSLRRSLEKAGKLPAGS